MTNNAKTVLEYIRRIVRDELKHLNKHDQISVAMYLREDTYRFTELYPSITKEVIREKSEANRTRTQAQVETR